MISKKSKIYIAGHKGLVGSALFRNLKDKGYSNLITANKKDLNLVEQQKVIEFLKKKKT